MFSLQAAGFSPNGAEVDHTSALVAVGKLEDRVRITEQELADIKFKVLMNQCTCNQDIFQFNSSITETKFGSL